MKKNHISYIPPINIKYNNAGFKNNHLLKCKGNGHRSLESRAALNTGADGRVRSPPPVMTRQDAELLLVWATNSMYYPFRLFR